VRTPLVVSTAFLFIVVGLLLTAFLIGPGLLLNVRGVQTQLYHQVPSSLQANPVQRENDHLGTTTWRIPPGKESTVEIQAYASAPSVPVEHWITFYASTQKAGTPYSIGIYRLGWYNGLGGRLMAPPVNLIGQAQGYYAVTVQLGITKHVLVNCASCLVNAKTGLIEANWQPSYKLYIPTDWTTGVYLAKFTDFRGRQTYVPFDVVGNFHALAVVVTPDTTYQAYNTWGGYSLYDNDTTDDFTGETDTSLPAAQNGELARAVKVSFDRPYVQEAGSAQVLSTEADAIHWLERKGYDLSYISDVDVQKNPVQLLNHTSYLSIGHDEYWTKEMRDGVEYARDHGVGLAFLGAGAVYWQMRFEPDSHGVRDRTVVCYKVDSKHKDLIHDPLYGKDNSRVTARWRDPIVGRPENALVGVMYSGLTHPVPGYPWTLEPKAKSPVLFGTGLLVRHQYGCDVVGYEWDRVFDNGASPRGLTVLGTSVTRNNLGILDESNTTYYIAKSGAMVFATGSIAWTTALDDYRLHFDKFCARQNPVVPQMQQLLVNIFHELGVRHPSGRLSPLKTSVIGPMKTTLPAFTASYQPSRLPVYDTRRRFL
jgi:hypothetical protein